MKNFSIKETLVKYSNLFYFISLSIGLLSFTWLDFKDVTFINKFDTIRIVISMFFLSLRGVSLLIIDKKYILKSLIVSLSFMISFCFFNQSVYFIQSLAFILCTYKIDKNKVIKIIITSSIITFLLALLGCISNTINITIDLPQCYSRFRCYFGFKHPSYFSIHYCAILFGTWYLYYKDSFIKTTIVFILSALFLFFVPNTRTSALLLLLFPIIYIFTKYLVNSNNKLLEKLVISLPTILTIASLILMFIIKASAPNSFLETFTIRFTQAHDYFNGYGIHLFKSSKLWLDNVYLFLLESFGIVCTITYISLLTLLNKNLIKEKNYHILSIALFFLIYALMDNYGINLRFNISLLFISEALINLDIDSHNH